ncbi:MAG TPA: hypothetical protein VFB96_14895 [Pirellulaceae bacterium]|nr:hypothetical protein [Pirellulaceae bacterium]
MTILPSKERHTIHLVAKRIMLGATKEQLTPGYARTFCKQAAREPLQEIG